VVVEILPAALRMVAAGNGEGSTAR